ncbi:MAG: DUF5335 family protein [Armatimonadetes bacterium]|nr:DUF5335 family protein [Armatimonadota bacterium]
METLPVPSETPERPFIRVHGAHRTREIPPDQWETFLRTFSRDYHTTAIRVEVQDVSGFGAQTLVETRPLIEVETDLKAGTPQIVLVAGDTLGETPAAIRHAIPRPRRLRVAETETGQICGLQFETEDGGTTTVTVGVVEEPLPEGESGLDAVMEELQHTP